LSAWRCPVCAEALALEGRSFRCSAKHCFDLAKEGYINLLLANQKKSLQPGDDKTQLQGRRRFLQQGFYQPLLDELYKTLTVTEGMALADIGCGEGYYSQGVATRAKADHLDLQLYGIDIAKDGVRLAAKEAAKHSAPGLPAIQYGVASSFNLPWQDASFDRVFRVFAPSKDQEVARVLHDDGLFIVVSPGPKHLLELRELLYDSVVEHAEPAVPEGFELQQSHSIGFTMSLENGSQLEDLLLMTPFNWRGQQEIKQTLSSCQADFYIQVYKKC